MQRGLSQLLICLCLLYLPAPLQANAFRVGLLHGDARLFDYELSVIRLALEHAPGQHDLEVVPMHGVSQGRIFAILNQDEGPINLFFSGYSPERAQKLLQVDIPMTRGLLGIRLFVVKASRLQELQGIQTLEQLREQRIGSGTGWPENDILRHHRFRLVISGYDNLWQMLNYERFDLLHRGIQEVFTEMGQPGRETLAILPDIALSIRYDYFLYVARHRQDLHDILLTGLQNAYRTGAFQSLFQTHPQIQTSLKLGQLPSRTLLHVASPENRELYRIPDKYWHHSMTP